jgi:hypothetical protein
MSDRFRMSDSAPIYALLIVLAAIVCIVIVVGAAIRWLV